MAEQTRKPGLIDVFITPRFNPKDFAYFGFIVLFGFVLIFNQIQTQQLSSYGAIYIPIYLLTIIFMLVSWIGDRVGLPLFNTVIFGDRWGNTTGENQKTLFDVLKSIAVGLGFGFLAISSLLLGIHAFSFLTIPLPKDTFSIASGFTLSGLAAVGITGLFSAEIEESFRASAGVPTIARLLGASNMLPVVLAFAGFIFIFIYNGFAGAIAIGILFWIFAALIFVGLLLGSREVKQVVSYRDIDRHIIAILIMAFIFAAFHVTSYHGQGLSGAFAFAIIADGLNWFLQDTISSRIGHAMNNSFVTAATYGVPFWVAGVVVLVYALIILGTFVFGNIQGIGQRIITGTRRYSYVNS